MSTDNCSNNNINTNEDSGTSNDNDTYNKTPKSKLCCFGYVDYIVLASTLSVALAEELSTNDLNILSTFFAVLSDELALISSVESICSNNGTSKPFAAPVPDVAITTSDNKNNYQPANRKKTRIKKIIKRKIKKK